jgi:3',5'-cyclic AMP phosphodiesterase CpdA
MPYCRNATTPPLLCTPLIAAVAAALAHCSAAQPQSEPPDLALDAAELAAVVDELALPDDAAVLIAAGDIARCNVLTPARATATLVEAFVAAADSAIVITAGDHAYRRGTREEFARCYGPTWGRFEAITRPSPGNHDYDTEEGAPFYEYFSFFDDHPAARARGYYSFLYADWHIVALNSLVSMDEDSPQIAWLEADLRAAAAPCILAYWHDPLYSSGLRSLLPWYRGRGTEPAWEVLLAHDAEIVVNGHEHLYERYAPLDSDGDKVAGGIRQFTVGTGGGNLSERALNRKNREALYGGYGVLVFSLEPGFYRYRFVGVDGAVHDQSSSPIACNG